MAGLDLWRPKFLCCDCGALGANSSLGLGTLPQEELVHLLFEGAVVSPRWWAYDHSSKSLQCRECTFPGAAM